MTVFPKEISDATTWAFFERYESINDYGRETARWRLGYLAVCVFGIALNLGVLSEIEAELSGVSVTLTPTLVFTLAVFAVCIVLAKSIRNRMTLEGHYYANLRRYFTDVVPSPYARHTKDFTDWRATECTETTALEQRSLSGVRVFDYAILAIFALSFVVPLWDQIVDAAAAPLN